ncbi:WAS/WASL-interacting protein family member 1-like [Haliaeetus albicilla]|uniref:WAS/WASL-interacting protein family member 1-like n=1 Tax=Haliaeetus albicilla TaxID=8969 RepID=UPI0037E732E8
MSEGRAGALDAEPASVQGQGGFAWAAGFLLQLVRARRRVPIPTGPPGHGWCSRWLAGPAPRGLLVSTGGCAGLAAGTLPGQPWLSAWLGTLGEAGRGKAALTASSHFPCKRGLPIAPARRGERFLAEGSRSTASHAEQASPCPRSPPPAQPGVPPGDREKRGRRFAGPGYRNADREPQRPPRRQGRRWLPVPGGGGGGAVGSVSRPPPPPSGAEQWEAEEEKEEEAPLLPPSPFPSAGLTLDFLSRQRRAPGPPPPPPTSAAAGRPPAPLPARSPGRRQGALAARLASAGPPVRGRTSCRCRRGGRPGRPRRPRRPRPGQSPPLARGGR